MPNFIITVVLFIGGPSVAQLFQLKLQPPSYHLNICLTSKAHLVFQMRLNRLLQSLHLILGLQYRCQNSCLRTQQSV